VPLDGAAVHHARLDARLLDFEHDQFDESVVDEDAVSRLHVVGNVVVRDRSRRGRQLLVAENDVLPASTAIGAASSPMRMRGPAGHRGSRRVAHARWPSGARGRCPACCSWSVREVDPGDIEPASIRRRSSRPSTWPDERTDDLGARDANVGGQGGSGARGVRRSRCKRYL